MDDELTVSSKRITVTISFYQETSHGRQPIRDFEAVFWIHGGKSTEWVSSAGTGVVQFNLYSMQCTCYFAVRKDDVTRDKVTPVNFFMCSTTLNRIEDNLKIQFVLKE